MYNDISAFIRKQYNTDKFIPLHEPCFEGNEKKYLLDCIDSTFVSSVGEYVNRFEEELCRFTSSKYAISVTNGTSALHLSFILANVNSDCEVLCPVMTFVATANAIRYCNAWPVFIDCDPDDLGMSPDKLATFLDKNTETRDDGFTYNIGTNKKIQACVVMHTFGHSAKLKELKKLCEKKRIVLIEDAAESIGSFYEGKHTGTVASIGTLSFNGNKTITCGGGGAILTQSKEIAERAKHLSTTAKKPHPWDYNHEELAFNYRMPNINAALACAQLEQLKLFVEKKRSLASKYKTFFERFDDIEFVSEPAHSRSNYWLNAILFKTKERKDKFLEESNKNGIMTRPVWKLMTDLAMYKACQRSDISVARDISERLVNIPSSVIL